jgi:hypothetical protein
MGPCVGLLGSYWMADHEVYQNICPWAARLRQYLYAYIQPMMYRVHALAGRAGPSTSLDLTRYAWPVVLPGH